MPDEHRPFFRVGIKYRVPGFIASSSSKDVTYQFIYKAIFLTICPQIPSIHPHLLQFLLIFHGFLCPLSTHTNACSYSLVNLFIQAYSEDQPPILWRIEMDPRGETDLKYRCKHVNYISNRQNKPSFILSISYA
jgi:hypothetical protein